MPFGREVAVDPDPGPHAIGGFTVQSRLAARQQAWAGEALLAGIATPPGVKPVARALQAGRDWTVGVMLVVHEGVLYRETSPVKAWFLVAEAIDRS
jgi:hypothetical protein